MKRFALMLGFVLSMVSCKKENDIPLLMVTPYDQSIAATSGDVMRFQIEGRSDNSTLNRLVITKKRGNGFTTTVVDSSLSGTRFSWNWEFVIAHATAAYDEEYAFTLFDANGEKMTMRRTLYVSLGETLLTESSGHLFYSRNSAVHPESAFDLQARVQVIYDTDSTLRDIQDNPANSTTTDLSRSWISPANGRLVRFNSYDYANATDISLRNAFNSGIPLQQVDDIQVGDVILTRLGSLPTNTNFYAAIRITGVVDDAGTADEDRYVFNMKWATFVD